VTRIDLAKQATILTLFTGTKNISTSVLGGQMVQSPKTPCGCCRRALQRVA